jgi:hypothetical protein
MFNLLMAQGVVKPLSHCCWQMKVMVKMGGTSAIKWLADNRLPLKVIKASEAELAQYEIYLDEVDKKVMGSAFAGANFSGRLARHLAY